MRAALAIPARWSLATVPYSQTSEEVIYGDGLVLTCQRKPLVPEVPGGLPPVYRYFILDVVDDDGEGEDEDAHDQEKEIGGHVDQLYLVHHGVELILSNPSPETATRLLATDDQRRYECISPARDA